MAVGIEIYDKNGKLNLASSDLTTFVLGEKHIDLMVNVSIQHDYLIGKRFWYSVLSFDSVPVGKFNQGNGMGYYIPDLSFNPNTGTATFTWSQEYYDTVFNKAEMQILAMLRNGYSGLTIIYGGM